MCVCFKVRVMVGIYEMYLRQWLKVFPREQIFIMRNEDYSNDISSHLKRVFNLKENSFKDEIKLSPQVDQ